MLKSIAVSSVVLLAAVAAPCQAGGSGVGKVDAAWAKAFVAGDADAASKCYAPDAVLWIPGAPMMKGSKEILAGYQGYFSANTVKDASLKEMGSRTEHGESVAWGTYTITSTPKAGGAAVTVTGRYTEVARRIGGKWVYTVDHASDDPVAPAKP